MFSRDAQRSAGAAAPAPLRVAAKQIPNFTTFTSLTILRRSNRPSQKIANPFQ